MLLFGLDGHGFVIQFKPLVSLGGELWLESLIGKHSAMTQRVLSVLVP